MIKINGFNNFYKILREKEQFEENQIMEIFENINEFIEKDIISIDFITLDKITDNSIYKLTINNKKEVILKIRYETSFLNFNDEINYLRFLSLMNLVPKQHFFMNINNQRLSVEECINGIHIEDGKTLSNENITILVEGLASFHVIDFKEIKRENIIDNDKFYFNYLSKDITYHGEESFNQTLNILETTNNTILLNYLERNKEKLNLIKNFLNEKYTTKDKLKDFIPLNSSHLVFSHNDIHNNNFILEKNNKIKFIDFEDLSFNFPGFDLANYIYESMFAFSVTYPYYIFNRNFMILSEELMLDYFNLYLQKLKEKEKMILCNQFTLSDIYKLITVSHLKAIYEYLFMFDINCVETNTIQIDYIMAICDIIQSFYYFKGKINHS